MYFNSQRRNIACNIWVLINEFSFESLAVRGYRHLNPNCFVLMIPANLQSCAPTFFYYTPLGSITHG